MTVRDYLDQEWKDWQAADLYGKWRKANPGEAALLDAYVANPAKRPVLATATGRALVDNCDAWYATWTPPLTAGSRKAPPSDAPADSVLPFPEAALRPGAATLTVPATVTSLGASGSPVNGGQDCLIDLQNIERARSLLIFGAAGQRIHLKNGKWWVTGSVTDGSPYWRGGPRVRTSDGVGPEHVSITDCFIGGPAVADGIAVAAGAATRVTIQRCRIEGVFQATGASTAEPAEHCDNIQIQGKIGVLEVGLCTLYPQSVNPPNDGGKGLQLKNEGGNLGFRVALSRVNMRGQGPSCGTFLLQTTRDILVTLTEVYVDTANSGAWNWDTGSGSGLFYPNASVGSTVAWVRSGLPGSYTAAWPSAAAITGQIMQGSPAGGDYVTRTMLGV